MPLDYPEVILKLKRGEMTVYMTVLKILKIKKALIYKAL